MIKFVEEMMEALASNGLLQAMALYLSHDFEPFLEVNALGKVPNMY